MKSSLRLKLDQLSTRLVELNGLLGAEDVTRDHWGTYIFVRDVVSGAVWSTGYQPTGVEPDAYRVTFFEDHAEFFRRVSLDVAGTLPTSELVRKFLDDVSPDKRQRAIESLLDSPGYAAWWTTFLCDLTGRWE